MDDPGWRRAVPLAIPMFPGRYVRLTTLTGLETLRGLWLSFFVVATGITGIAAAVFTWDEPSTTALITAIAISVVSIVTVVLVPRVRPLDTTSAAPLGRSYRVRFFVRIAAAQAALLVGFVLSAVDESSWLAIVGGAFALSGLLVAAPTRSRVEHEQARIAGGGTPLRLIESLGVPQPAS